ncbi:HAD-IIA family hydrolase [Paraconexibacter sp.]|uniref:HAD-IIA family hydrolase n=1 Tax=Paraconexibacter sp. TaxID=2949640 RepID=UPI0035681C9D
MSLSPLLTRYDHVLLDLDGCVRIGKEPTPRAVEAVDALRNAGKRVAFVTNDSALSEEALVRSLWAMGLRAAVEDVVTVGGAIQFTLAQRPQWRTAFVIGPTAIWDHVQDAGTRIVNGTTEVADVVVVTGARSLGFEDLKGATQAVLAGAALLSGGRDRTFPMPDGPWPGTGAVTAAIEWATEREAEIVGKPDPQIFRTALDRLGPGRALMVGDRLDSDLAGAHAAGIDGAIVLTGVSTREQAQTARAPAPVAIADTLADLVLAS